MHERAATVLFIGVIFALALFLPVMSVACTVGTSGRAEWRC